MINVGFIIERIVGNTVKLAKELVAITKAIRRPKSASMLNFDKMSTAKPAPTEMALNKIALPEP